jgi:hypothetical protein
MTQFISNHTHIVTYGRFLSWICVIPTTSALMFSTPVSSSIEVDVELKAVKDTRHKIKI